MFNSIAIIGTGAVGGYYGARLAQHGRAVHFLMRSDYTAVFRNGLSIESRDGDFYLSPTQLNLYDRPEAMPKVDLVIVTLKTTANDQFERLIRPVLHEGTAILTLQNGLGNEEKLAELFGAKRILGGLAFTCINRVAPGRIQHLDHGQIRLGEFGGGPSARAAAIAEMFVESRVSCEVLDDLRYGRWTKLVWNIPFNGLGAVMDLETDRLIATVAGEKLVRKIMAEVIAAARGAGVGLDSEIIDQQIMRTKTMGAYKTSMQIDRKNRRSLEIDSIIRIPLESAKYNRVEAPLIETIFRQLEIL